MLRPWPTSFCLSFLNKKALARILGEVGNARTVGRPSGACPLWAGALSTERSEKLTLLIFSGSEFIGPLLFPVSLFHHTPRKTSPCKKSIINHSVSLYLCRVFWRLKKIVNGSVHTSVNGFVNTLVNTFVHTSVHYTVNKFVNGSAYLLPFNGLPVVFSRCEQIC